MQIACTHVVISKKKDYQGPALIHLAQLFKIWIEYLYLNKSETLSKFMT